VGGRAGRAGRTANDGKTVEQQVLEVRDNWFFQQISKYGHKFISAATIMSNIMVFTSIASCVGYISVKSSSWSIWQC
jgi:hypothetical protein